MCLKTSLFNKLFFNYKNINHLLDELQDNIVIKSTLLCKLRYTFIIPRTILLTGLSQRPLTFLFINATNYIGITCLHKLVQSMNFSSLY